MSDHTSQPGVPATLDQFDVEIQRSSRLYNAFQYQQRLWQAGLVAAFFSLIVFVICVLVSELMRLSGHADKQFWAGLVEEFKPRIVLLIPGIIVAYLKQRHLNIRMSILLEEMSTQLRRHISEKVIPLAKVPGKRHQREKIAKAQATHTKSQWEALKIAYDHRCLGCGRQEPNISLAKDHIVPISLGGSDHILNIQPLCKSCNSAKLDKVIDYRKQVTK